MRMELQRMAISNFKGIRHFEIDFDQKRTAISGANGTGKTSIADAFSWCLFNKDSQGNAPGTASFREKPLDDDGNEIHNLDTTVELFCTLDGQRFDLKRTQRENWVKKRGSADQTFQGNVSTYWINGVETQLQEFKKRVGEIANEDGFRLVGVLSAFNALEWKKRRQQLLAMSEVDVDGELLSRDEYRPVADALAEQNVSVDDLRKATADKIKNAKSEAKLLPVRIDEARKSLPTFKPREVHDAEYIITDSKKDIEKIDAEIAATKANMAELNSEAEILALQRNVLIMQQGMREELVNEKRKVQGEVASASMKVRDLSGALDSAKHELKDFEERIELMDRDLVEMRKQYKGVKNETCSVDETCPTCHQPMPQEMLDQIREDFDRKKNERAESIRERGKALGAKLEGLKEKHTETEGKIEVLNAQKDEASAEREAALDRLNHFPLAPDFDGNPDIVKAKARIEELRAETKKTPDEHIRGLEERKRDLNGIIERNMQVLIRRDAGLETEKRIKAYEARQAELGDQITQMEALLILLERFVQDRCSALEESINAMFPTVRWKLFDTQINGGIVDTCECMIPCDSGLVDYSAANTAAQINADIEIVNVLSQHYGVQVPLFVDNSERVNSLARTDSQIITLAVSTDHELTIKNEEE